MKLCAKCGVNPRQNENNAYCRPCKNEIDLKSYHNHKTKRREYQDDYLNKNPDKYRGACINQAKKFSVDNFIKQIKKEINDFVL